MQGLQLSSALFAAISHDATTSGEPERGRNRIRRRAAPLLQQRTQFITRSTGRSQPTCVEACESRQPHRAAMLLDTAGKDSSKKLRDPAHATKSKEVCIHSPVSDSRLNVLLLSRTACSNSRALVAEIPFAMVPSRERFNCIHQNVCPRTCCLTACYPGRTGT